MYIQLVSVHGLIRGDRIEMGRDADTGGQVRYVVDLARNLRHGAAGRVPPFSFQPDRRRTVPIMPITDLRTHYYFRFAAIDRPGVLSKIAGILGAHDISLKSVHQHGREENGGAVPIVMLTHLAHESAVQRAFEAISQLDVVRDDPVLIRIEDTDAEHEGPGCVDAA